MVVGSPTTNTTPGSPTTASPKVVTMKTEAAKAMKAKAAPMKAMKAKAAPMKAMQATDNEKLQLDYLKGLEKEKKTLTKNYGMWCDASESDIDQDDNAPAIKEAIMRLDEIEKERSKTEAALAVMKKPASSVKTLKRPAASGSARSKAARWKASAKKSADDDADDNEDDDKDDDDGASDSDEDDTGHLDAGIGKKYNKLKTSNSLPEYIVEYIEKESIKSSKPRSTRTRLINALIKKTETGQLKVNTNAPEFETYKQIYNRKYGKDEYEAMDKDIMVATTFHGDEAKFEKLVSAGKIREVDVGGETMYAFRKVTAGTEEGSNKVAKLHDGTKALTNDEHTIASGAFSALMKLGC